MIETQEELEALIAEWGFMPFFRSAVEGMSTEDIMPSDLLFGEKGMPWEDGAWQWRGDIISHWRAAYGKFFGGKAGYVSLDWLPDLMNVRRARYPLESYTDETRGILDTLRRRESMPSRELKRECGFTLSRRRRVFDPDNPGVPKVNRRNGSSFDAQIGQLQMGTWVCIADFEYDVSRDGRAYGWGVARYCTPEAMYEMNHRQLVDGRTPEESRQRIIDHLSRLFPNATERQWSKVI